MVAGSHHSAAPVPPGSSRCEPILPRVNVTVARRAAVNVGPEVLTSVGCGFVSQGVTSKGGTRKGSRSKNIMAASLMYFGYSGLAVVRDVAISAVAVQPCDAVVSVGVTIVADTATATLDDITVKSCSLRGDINAEREVHIHRPPSVAPPCVRLLLRVGGVPIRIASVEPVGEEAGGVVARNRMPVGIGKFWVQATENPRVDPLGAHLASHVCLRAVSSVRRIIVDAKHLVHAVVDALPVSPAEEVTAKLAVVATLARSIIRARRAIPEAPWRWGRRERRVGREVGRRGERRR